MAYLQFAPYVLIGLWSIGMVSLCFSTYCACAGRRRAALVGDLVAVLAMVLLFAGLPTWSRMEFGPA